MEIKIYSNPKFKSIFLSCNYLIDVKKEEYSKYALLSLVMSKSCKKYKTNKEIERYLSENYGAKLDVAVSKVGELYNLDFRIEFLNDKAIKNESIFEKMLYFMNDIINEPNISNKEFDKNLFEREKENLIDRINAHKDDKLRYGVSRIEEVLCENENYGYYVYGTVEDAEKITNKDLVMAYETMINTAYKTVTLCGDFEDSIQECEIKINDILKLGDNKEKIENIREKICPKISSRGEKREVIERENSNQAVLGIGVSLDVTKEDKLNAEVFNSILGGTPSSKLFQNVREKNSLCYTTRSVYHGFKDILVIYAGIDEDDFKKAEKVIIEQIEDMKNGNISDIELSSAKESLVSSLRESVDSKINISKRIYVEYLTKNNNINDDFSSATLDSIINDKIEKIQNVTVEDVVNIANKTKVNLVYLLGGEKSE